MQDTECVQQILRLLYHEQFELSEPQETDIRQWARTEQIGECTLQEIVASLSERGLVRVTDEPLSCRLSAKGTFWVEDSGLVPAHSATHQFAVRLALLQALSLYSQNREAACCVTALAERAGVSSVDCGRCLPILEDAGWARTDAAGRSAITVKGLQTLHEWRIDLRSRVSGDQF